MSLVPGVRFGPYEIRTRLGAGGMGEVYRAHDARLHRDVALKILPPSVATDPERQRRFAEEAIAAGALNHPNILAVYDVGVEAGAQYIVSELIEGTWLRAEMDRGRVPVKRLLELGVQLASGLTAAHGAGFVHRDLKPENVMVTRDGRVKIVDFGLAKALRPDAPEGVDPSGRTQTAAGLIVGTVPYMSPEQAAGGRVDFHSDQFSLGVMLYEMATGVHPFQRETAVQTLSAVIGDEPRSLAEAHPSLPVPLRWSIERCLAKDPGERYGHTVDLAADLRQVRDGLVEAVADSTAIAVAAARPRRWQLAGGATILAAFAFGMGAHVAPSTADFSSYRYTPFATDAGIQGSPAWSPDGKTIAYVAEVEGVLQVFTRSLASSMREQLTRLRFDARAPFWSPDGTRIYFHSLARDKEALWSISPAGGQPELVVEGAARAAISPDGQTLAVLRDESISDVRLTLWFSSPPGAEPKRYTRPPFDKENFGSLLRFSPDGSQLLIWSDYGILKGFWMIQLPESDPRGVLPSLQGPRAGLEFTWLPDSRHVVVVRNDGPTSGTHLWLADIVTDTSRPLTITNGNEGSPAVSPDGSRIAFTSEATDFDLVLVPLDGSPPRSFLSSTRNELDPAWSPTAAQYAFVTDRTGSQEIWIRSEQDNWERALVGDSDFGGASSTLLFSSLVFSPDGRRLAYQRFERDERGRIWISSLAGGPPIPLLESGVSYQDAPTWSPDGTWVAFVSTITPDRWSLAKARVGGGGAALVVLKEEIVPQSRPHWSPDGRWILCQTTEGLVLVHPDSKESRVLSEQEWLSYEWAADARRVYGIRLSDDQTRLMLVMLDVGTLKEQVVNGDVGFLPIAQQPIRGFSRVRDTAFLTSIARPRSDIWLLDGFSPPTGLLARFWPWRRGTLD